MSYYQSLDKQLDSNLTKEEKEFIYYALLARKNFFEEEMIDAASRKDTNRITECNNVMLPFVKTRFFEK